VEQPLTTLYPISDIVEWDYTGQLVIAPKFQRRDVWPFKAKSYLIDTILRAMPIPPLFLRTRIDPLKKRAIREVVDGQQRLRAVLGFIKGDFPILEVHNSQYPGYYYDNLPEDVQRAILGYRFAVNLLQDITDKEVLNIFARMNTYTVRLDPQELRNAEFFGLFKQTIYDLALRHLSFWANNRIFTFQQIARMREAELVSTLVVTMLDGIRQTKDKDLREFYEMYDDTFPEAGRVMSEFEHIINQIGNIFGETLTDSEFRRVPLFYSLYSVLYDAQFGLPNSDHPRRPLISSHYRWLAQRLHEISDNIGSENPPDEYYTFIDATRLSTADPGKRRLRHDFLWNHVIANIPEAVSSSSVTL
jgi:hypothetical protein